MRSLRLGIFNRETSPSDGGANTLLGTVAARLRSDPAAGGIELVEIPWADWSYRRRPLRRLRVGLARILGQELPSMDVRALCRSRGLDLAYFPAPAFVAIDIPFIMALWDAGHRTIPEFPEVRAARDSWAQREALGRQVLPRASAVIVGNRTGAEEAIALFGLRPERVIPLPFPNPDFSGVVSARPAWLPSVPYFLYPAQLWPHKNHHTLLRALAALQTKSVVADLVFVGADKDNAEYLRAAARELGVASRVHFGGFVSRGELRALYENAVALVFPSLLGPNNLPPQEAAVLGCPVVLSDLPGHREQLGPGALYAAPLAADAWADAMQQLLSDPGRRTALVQAARTAVAGCTAEHYAAELSRLFSGLAAQRRLWG
jgi:glycosyltransferase involved in cell wall biosynthesis